MQVETFECTETAAEPIEASEEAIALLEKLGLEGQKELVTKHEETGRDTRCPYREMRADEAFVYGQLCPQKVDATTYRASPIPLRVLQVLAHAKSLNIFTGFQVWDKRDSSVKDPVLVGLIGEEWYSSSKRFILARWGEVLESWPTLVKQALTAWNNARKAELRKIKAEVEAAIVAADAADPTEIPERAELPQVFRL